MDKNLNTSSERKLNCSDESKCFELLESILDGEETTASKEILDEKLAKCQPCFEHYHLEKVIREVLKNKCTKHMVPAELADTIRQKIQEIK
ncbi:anti-sigma factor [Cyclobacterium salsum]|uniref:anti-sigma factor n=1 Tax=Cyclobacterium salsum TaxID=2666329 RepID=UPI00139174A4|nr:anti-sigma factor [Cyclobacterium salsum]